MRGKAAASGCRNAWRRVRNHRVRGQSLRGFSLIEIIIVVVLIAAIVAFAASRIRGGSDRAKVNLAKSQLQTLAPRCSPTRWIPARCPPSCATW